MITESMAEYIYIAANTYDEALRLYHEMECDEEAVIGKL